MNSQVHMIWGSLPAALLPRSWAEAVADRAGDLSWKLSSRARRNAEDNLRQLLGADGAPQHVRGAFRTYARYYLGMMRLAHRDLVPAVGAVTWSNAEALHASLRRGRGALVLSAHLGHWDAAGAALARRFGGLSVFVEPLRPAVLFDFYRRARGRHGIRVIPAGQTSRAPIEVLRHNGLLGLVADRAFGVRRERVPCGTGQLLVPAGGIRMALRAGAAIHTAFGVRRHDGFEVRVGADLRPEVRLLRDEAARVHRIGTLFAAELGQIVRLHPEQWCLLHRMDEMETTPPARRGAA